MYYKTEIPSPVGNLTVASDGECLIGLWLEGQKYYESGIKQGFTRKDDLPIFSETKKWLKGYFKGLKPSISSLRLNPQGGEFRQRVWGILCEIPYGQVITYGEIAKKIAELTGRETMSAQAVGGAVGHNPISIIIPCHRVVGASGSLTGYAGGIEAKIKLLEIEGVDLAAFSIPKKGSAL